MPPTHTTEGLEAARTIREELPQVAILVLSAHIEVEHAMDLLGAGRGIGYVLKSRVGDVDELCDTLDRISSGGSVVDPALVEELVRARRARDPLEQLTARERDVLALMAEGRSNAGIARAPLDRRGHRREAREEHLPEAAAPGRAGRSPPRAGRDRVSRFDVGRPPERPRRVRRFRLASLPCAAKSAFRRERSEDRPRSTGRGKATIRQLTER